MNLPFTKTPVSKSHFLSHTKTTGYCCGNQLHCRFKVVFIRPAHVTTAATKCLSTRLLAFFTRSSDEVCCDDSICTTVNLRPSCCAIINAIYISCRVARSFRSAGQSINCPNVINRTHSQNENRDALRRKRHRRRDGGCDWVQFV